MKRGCLVCIVLIACAIDAFAVPAKRIPVTVKQCDGTSITLHLIGDECFHYFITNDSIPVFEKNSSYYLGYVDNGSLSVSNVVAHDENERNDVEKAFICSHADKVKVFLKDNGSLAQPLNTTKIINNPLQTRALGGFNTYVGSKKGLVILVNFANLSMKTNDAQNTFDKFFNEEGYSDNNSIGSVHDYFYDQSYGKFDLTFDVIGPVTVSKNYEYYGTNSELSGIDRNIRDMIIETCRQIDELVNFQDYDWDGDGEVDQVCFIYAGYGESGGAPSNTIWPHKSSLGGRAITLDGVTINTYACSSELTGNTGTEMEGIGTFCHEFSHCLGIPDFYDTDYSGAFGMSYWDLMDSGAHSGPNINGEVPYGYSAYERWVLGWLEPVEITESQRIENLGNLGDAPDAYIIYNKGNTNEFYILENHQPTRWFQYVARFEDFHGLMVTHVDYDEKAWRNNNVNPNREHQRLTIIPADNSYGESETEFRGDLFPGRLNVNWFTNTSHAETGGLLYNRNTDHGYYMNREIGSICEHEDGTLSFDVIFDNDIFSPSIKEIFNVNDENFSVIWEDIEGADYYNIEHVAIDRINPFFPTTKSEKIERISDNSITLSWLSDKGSTKIRINVVKNGITSPWSEYFEVSRTTGIGSVICDEQINPSVYGIEGVRRIYKKKGLNIINSNGQSVKIIVK